jgi:predicted transposase YdaD
MQKAFYNVKTGETIIEDFTAEETKEAEAKEAERLEALQKKQAKQLEILEARSAAEEKLMALGLTTEDLKALLG